MLRRPKPGDTEEDLLLYQEKFLASKSSPAATVTKKRKPQDDEKKSASTTNVQAQKDVVTLEGKVALCGQTPWADTPPPGQTPAPLVDGYCSGRYASYWNAFLYCD